jgi:hypothetical protein
MFISYSIHHFWRGARSEIPQKKKEEKKKKEKEKKKCHRSLQPLGEKTPPELPP